jgi:hypothetical protein
LDRIRVALPDRGFELRWAVRNPCDHVATPSKRVNKPAANFVTEAVKMDH